MKSTKSADCSNAIYILYIYTVIYTQICLFFHCRKHDLLLFYQKYKSLVPSHPSFILPVYLCPCLGKKYRQKYRRDRNRDSNHSVNFSLVQHLIRKSWLKMARPPNFLFTVSSDSLSNVDCNIQ